jgi:alpha-N-arabinofuranosidase
MANLAQSINVLQALALTKDEKMILTPTYHVMEMYAVHQDAVMLPLEVSSPVYLSGSDTLKAISASASRDRQGITHISLVNIDPRHDQQLMIATPGATYTRVTSRVLAGGSVQDHNTFDEPARVAPREWDGARMEQGAIRVQLPPCSVVMLTLK